MRRLSGAAPCRGALAFSDRSHLPLRQVEELGSDGRCPRGREGLGSRRSGDGAPLANYRRAAHTAGPPRGRRQGVDPGPLDRPRPRIMRTLRAVRRSWPEGKDFAFTIIDDTDNATLARIRPIYELLSELGLRTTKTVWVYPAPESERWG